MLGLKGKTNHFQLKHIPHKSTLSDANSRRTHLVFEEVYYSLLKQYGLLISDSRKIYDWQNKVEIIDISTISIFEKTFFSRELCLGIAACTSKNYTSNTCRFIFLTFLLILSNHLILKDQNSD
jgi:hypothetical protein